MVRLESVAATRSGSREDDTKPSLLISGHCTNPEILLEHGVIHAGMTVAQRSGRVWKLAHWRALNAAIQTVQGLDRAIFRRSSVGSV